MTGARLFGPRILGLLYNKGRFTTRGGEKVPVALLQDLVCWFVK